MARTLITSLVSGLAAPALVASLATPCALAQRIDHTFDQGLNPDGWVAWDSAYSSVVSGAGNPFEHLELDNVGGPTTCQFVFVEPTGPGPFEHSGNWRAAGVTSVKVDLDIRSGRFDGIFCLFLADDVGTPNDRSDDCFLVYILPAPLQPGWTPYSFDVPSASTAAAPGWFLGGACANANLNQRWNQIMTSVDYMFFVLDAIPGAACAPTNWDLGIDNISVQRGGLGSVYCTAEPNSTGFGAQLEATGSASIAANDVTLRVESLPPLSFGLFVMSRTTDRVPLLDGTLCVGQPLTRFLEIEQASVGGLVQRGVDLTLLPGLMTFTPGETWHFQYWHRDLTPAPSANLSEALRVTWL